MRGGGTIGIVIEQIGRFGDGFVVVQAQLLGAGVPFAVWSLVPVAEHERLGLIAPFLQPLERFIGDYIRHIPLDVLPALGGEEVRVVVLALARQHHPVVKPVGSLSRCHLPITQVW